MRYLIVFFLFIASLALPSCMMYDPRPAVVVTAPMVVQPRPYWHVPRGNAYGWRAHHCYNYNYYQPQGPGFGAPYGYPAYPHRGPRR